MPKLDIETLSYLAKTYPDSTHALMWEMARAVDVAGMNALLDVGCVAERSIAAAPELLRADGGAEAQAMVIRWLNAAKQKDPQILATVFFPESAYSAGFIRLDKPESLAFLRLAVSQGLDLSEVVQLSNEKILHWPTFRDAKDGENFRRVSFAAGLSMDDWSDGSFVAAMLREAPLSPDCPGGSGRKMADVSLLELLAMGCKYVQISGFLEGVSSRHGETACAQAAQTAMDTLVQQVSHNQKRIFGRPLNWHCDNAFSRMAATLLSHGAGLSVDQLEVLEKSWVCDGAGKTSMKLAHCIAAFSPSRVINGESRLFVDSRDEVDESLAVAHNQRCVSALRKLRELSFDVHSALSSDERRPLHMAADAGNALTYGALIDLGADPSAKDQRGWTAQSYAKKAGPDFLALLRSMAAQKAIDRPFDGCKPLAP